MIIRTPNKSMGDTSKQRLVKDCCNNMSPQMRVESLSTWITCGNCHKLILMIIPENSDRVFPEVRRVQ